MASLEKRIRSDALVLASDDLGVDEHGIIEGFRWVAYEGEHQSLRVHVFPRPIRAGSFFDRLSGSIHDLLSSRPRRGIRAAPRVRISPHERSVQVPYLSTELLAHLTSVCEHAAREDRTGVSRIFISRPKRYDLLSRSFEADEIDSYVPHHRSHADSASSIERFVRIDRFGRAEPGDLDLIVRPELALDRIVLEKLSPRGYRVSVPRSSSSRSYRMRTVELVREGLVDDHWYVDVHDVIGAIRAYHPSSSGPS